MATKEQCQYYNQCGFVKWRASGVERQVLPLPKDGDCGIDLLSCSRLGPYNPVAVEAPHAQTFEEMVVSFRLIPNSHGRPPKRIEGGANR